MDIRSVSAGRLLPTLSLLVSLPNLTVHSCPTHRSGGIRACCPSSQGHTWSLHLLAADMPLLSLPLPTAPEPVLSASALASAQSLHISNAICCHLQPLSPAHLRSGTSILFAGSRLPQFIPSTACRPVLSLQAVVGGKLSNCNPSLPGWPFWSLLFFSAVFLSSLMNSWHGDLRRLATSSYVLATMTPLGTEKPDYHFPENSQHQPRCTLLSSSPGFSEEVPLSQVDSSTWSSVCHPLCCPLPPSHCCCHSVAISKALELAVCGRVFIVT